MGKDMSLKVLRFEVVQNILQVVVLQNMKFIAKAWCIIPIKTIMNDYLKL